jgi:hypothetical protein
MRALLAFFMLAGETAEPGKNMAIFFFRALGMVMEKALDSGEGMDVILLFSSIGERQTRMAEVCLYALRIGGNHPIVWNEVQRRKTKVPLI